MKAEAAKFMIDILHTGKCWDVKQRRLGEAISWPEAVIMAKMVWMPTAAVLILKAPAGGCARLYRSRLTVL